MALTASNIVRVNSGDHEEVFFDLTFDSSYPTGGEDYTVLHEALGFELKTVRSLEAQRNGTHFFRTDYTNRKVLAYPVATPQTEVANLTNLSAVVTRCRAVGR